MAATAITDPEARALADAILQVSASQPPAEAARFIEMAVARAPAHPLVLNSAGGHLLRSGNAQGARELFQRALQGDPRSKVLWLNLASACRALRDDAAESAALDEALQVEPRYVAALLQKAELMERLARPRQAFFFYEAALDSLASGAPAPPQAGGALEHAQRVVSGSRRALEEFLEAEVAPVRSMHPQDDSRRYEACRDVYLRKRRVYHSQPKQLLFPYLPEHEFFPRALTPWLEALEAWTEEIAAEALAAFRQQPEHFTPYVDVPPGVPVDEWKALNRSRDWSVYRLWHDGEADEAHVESCPRTAAALSGLPLCDIPGYGPGVFFSVLQPHTRLPPHTGTTNTRSIVHLPLIVPEGCGFRVGGETRSWQRGSAWVFDDSIEHEAWNDSEEPRIILIFDVWNPLLSPAERDLVRALTQGIGRFYGEDAPELGAR